MEEKGCRKCKIKDSSSIRFIRCFRKCTEDRPIQLSNFHYNFASFFAQCEMRLVKKRSPTYRPYVL